MRRHLRCARTILALAAGAYMAAAPVAAQAKEEPIPPSPHTWVTDNVGVLSASVRDTLETRLAQYNKATGHQVIVWIGSTTGDTPLEDWTIRAFTAWKVGRKGLDDGLALFFFMQDRKVRIEVGYGLEPVVTDATASSIIRNEIVPRMRQGEVDAAVTAGVSSLLATIGGENGASPEAYKGSSNTDTSIFWVIFAVILIFIVAIAVLSRGRRYYTIGSGPIFWSGSSGGWGGWGGGGGGGGGGFSGGGGMGGGGGASGGW